MKKTLLDIVRNILSTMDSDDVTTIGETPESLQVADIVRTTYENMMVARDWASLKTLFKMNHSGEMSKPTHMVRPDNLTELLSYEYDCSKTQGTTEYRVLKYLDPDTFLMMTATKSKTSTSKQTVVDYSGVKFEVSDNKFPEFYTSFDDKYIVLDSYNKKYDDALRSSKTRCWGFMIPEWKHKDDFVPNLPVDLFPVLIEEARSVCFFNLKQMANDKAEQAATRLRRRMSQKSWTINEGSTYPNYGRRRVK